VKKFNDRQTIGTLNYCDMYCFFNGTVFYKLLKFLLFYIFTILTAISLQLLYRLTLVIWPSPIK